MGDVAFRIPALLLPFLIEGCAAMTPARPPALAPRVEVIADPIPIAWKEVITPADQARLGRIGEAWEKGLAAAARFKAAMHDEGPFLDPAVALPRAAPSPGPYRCRVVKLGGRAGFAAFRPFDCFVEAEGELLTMVKGSGSQRPAGRLWTDSDTRQIFLGALAIGNAAPPPYAANAQRDIVGFLERVDAFRWRLAVPFPQDGAMLDIYELVPAVTPRS